jgi:taurine dioxygenase
MSVEIVPLGRRLAAEVRGVDLRRPLSAADAEAVRQAWFTHLVLRFRGQRLDDPQLIAFSRNFGALDRAAVSEVAYTHVAPEVTVVSNIVVDGKPIGSLGAGEALWHTDSSCAPVPPDGSALYAIEIPGERGNTQFCNMYEAYERLPADVKASIAGLRTVHDNAYTAAGSLRMGKKPVTDVRQTQGAQHPLVRTHPVTGRKALYLGRRRNSYVEQSERLLDLLWSYATDESGVWTQVWSVGDLILWDNRAVMHRRDEFDPQARRLLHRTQITGSTAPY